MRIRTAIFAVYFVASAVGFAVLMRFTLAEVRPRYLESLQRTLRESATLLASTLGAREPPWAAELAAMQGAAEGLRVVVVDEAGTVVLDSRPREAAASEVGPAPALLMDSGLAKRVAAGLLDAELRGGDERGEVAATVPIRDVEGRERGWVVVSRPLRSVDALIWAERKRLAAGALLVAGATAAAGWWLAARLTHSLERLTAYVQAVRDGQAATPPGSRAQEVVTLGRAFEEMRVALEGKAYVERYVQALTHEIKSPLSAIRGAAELLAEEPPVEARRRFVRNIHGEARRMQRVVDQMLQLATLEVRQSQPARETVDLAGLVAEQVEARRDAAEARGVTLTFAVAGEGGTAAQTTVLGDRALLSQALANVLENALEFTPAQGRVQVTVDVSLGAAAAANPMVLVRVCDTGPGVPEYARERVFERFYSLPRPGTGAKSTGLGLSLVREILALHGGTATLTTQPEGGACAELRLPQAGDGAGASPVAAPGAR